MWDNPALLNRVSTLLFVMAATIAAFVGVRTVTEGYFPFREVTVLGARHHETRQAMGQVVGKLQGGFFTMDLDAARATFETVPWVRQATIRRMWPNRLLVEIDEHVPAAAWNGQRTLNTHGEVFPVQPWAGLPRFHAPEGMENDVARRYAEFHRILAPSGWLIDSIQVSPRHAWRVGLAGGVSLELGRERLNERVRRFVAFYPLAVASLGPLTQIDLRYPNGFAAQKPKAQLGKA